MVRWDVQGNILHKAPDPIVDQRSLCLSCTHEVDQGYTSKTVHQLNSHIDFIMCIYIILKKYIPVDPDTSQTMIGLAVLNHIICGFVF